MKNNLKCRLCMLLVCALLVPCLSAPASAIQFTDVPANHWTAPSIQRCVDLGFFKGETATSFGLGHDMTRAAFAVVLSLLASSLLSRAVLRQSSCPAACGIFIS